MYKFPKNWHFLPSYAHTYMWKMLISIKNFAYVREDPFRNANWWWLGKCSYNDASKKCKTNNGLLVLWSIFSVSMMIWSTVGILACLFSFFFQFFDKYHHFLAICKPFFLKQSLGYFTILHQKYLMNFYLAYFCWRHMLF